jgi:hypothetical protein
MSLDAILITIAIVTAVAIALVLIYKATSAAFWVDIAIALGDRAWDAVGPKIIAKLTARMPPDEEKAWKEFKKSHPDKGEEQKWLRDYQKRKKAREAAAKSGK